MPVRPKMRRSKKVVSGEVDLGQFESPVGAKFDKKMRVITIVEAARNAGVLPRKREQVYPANNVVKSQ